MRIVKGTTNCRIFHLFQFSPIAQMGFKMIHIYRVISYYVRNIFTFAKGEDLFRTTIINYMTL